MKKQTYFLGLDIGTDSVGYAVTDEKYNLLKFKGEPVWGSHIFEAASLNTERRSFRTSRRRLERRKQRVMLLQELFADEIAKIDPKFFIRLQESYRFRDEVDDSYTLFNDPEFTDKDYHKQYPTIHHLIVSLMKENSKHDVRLVYLALSWLISHRGHFLSNINKANLNEIKDFNAVYTGFIQYFLDNSFRTPWECDDIEALGSVLKNKQGITAKTKTLVSLLYGGKKPSKEPSEEFPFSEDAIIKLLAGGTVKLKDLYCDEEYTEYGSVALSMDDDKLGEIMANIGDRFDLITAVRSIYDWSLLVDVLGDSATISEAKVNVYEQHKKDLADLKYIVKKYIPKEYKEIFRSEDKDNYVAYVYHTNSGNTSAVKKKGKEDFSKYILSKIKAVIPEKEDEDMFNNMIERLEIRSFMPKQKDTDNRVIPHQLYWYELNKVLENAANYHPFLKKENDESGLTVAEKIEKIFLFKIPYFVGPLNPNSKNAWLVRKTGKIYPWNFDDMVDLDASEQNFIQRMTNTCTYLPGEPVLPKDSLSYHKFLVLNEINNLRINGERISVELKQKIYNELFCKVKKVTRKKLVDYLISNNIIGKNDEDLLSGIDIEIKSNLSPFIAFRQLFDSGRLSEEDAERIIERSSYAEDKIRLRKWLDKTYPQLSDPDKKYLCGLKFKDFGRLSEKFLTGFEGVCKETGEAFTILGAMWNTQCNLMELLSERYTFAENLKEYHQAYYSENKRTLEKKLDDMYLSNAVRRPIYRTLDIISDINKVFGPPSKIFVETTRGGKLEQKGKRTLSRKQQILELYAKFKDEDVRLLKQQLEAMGEYSDNRLQGDKLFLYYMQLGKCMYTGKPIELEKLGSKTYDIDHIYPQALVKDDSIINNKVLVLSSANGEKSDKYPIKDSIRHSMRGYWEFLKATGLISEEKFKRLTRATPFSEDEKWGFINRQLTETSQSTKAIANLLKEQFPKTEIVYCKARLTSEFRHEFGLVKSRLYNDLHHAVDAYLNIVTGNVYNMRFSRQWFRIDNPYSIKTTTLFTHPVICNGKEIWAGEADLEKVKKVAKKNTAHFSKYTYFKKGGLFAQMPVPASDSTALIPMKKNKDTTKYGGYNKASVMFFIPVRYQAGKKSEIIVMSVELMYGSKFMQDDNFAREYSFDRLKRILGKSVDDVSFPMGMRPWKINTVLSLDGFRICLAGISSGGKCLIAQPIVQFSAAFFWQNYLKKTESFVDKNIINSHYVYDQEHDFISIEKNIELYDLYITKLQASIYTKRINAPINTLVKGKETFIKLTILEQAKAILNIHQVFGRSSGGCDLTAVGGVKRAAATLSFSATISNWGKQYKEVYLIDQSASGIWETKSQNLLELL